MDMTVLGWPEMLTSTICPRPALQFADLSGAAASQTGPPESRKYLYLVGTPLYEAGKGSSTNPKRNPPTHIPEKATKPADKTQHLVPTDTTPAVRGTTPVSESGQTRPAYSSFP